NGDVLHPVQEAFIKHDAFQCGYCTSGQICSAVGLLDERHADSDAEVREQMSGNLCRCGAYPNIVAAIQEARAAHTHNAWAAGLSWLQATRGLLLMELFPYVRTEEPGAAVKQVSGDARARFLAGGTNLVDFMRLNVEPPTRLVDINHLPLAQVQ